MAISTVVLEKSYLSQTIYQRLRVGGVDRDLYLVQYPINENFGSQSNKIFIPYCESIIESSMLEAIRLTKDNLTFWSIEELNDLLKDGNNADYFEQEYLVYMSKDIPWQNSATITYENIEDYYRFIQVNDDILNKTVDRTVATFLKWGNSTTQIIQPLTNFSSSDSLEAMLNSIGTGWRKSESAILISKSKTYLWKNEEVLQKHFVIKDYTNSDNHYQIINENLPGYQYNASQYTVTSRKWGEVFVGQYTPFQILAHPISFVKYWLSQYSSVENFINTIQNELDRSKSYIIARINNQYQYGTFPTQINYPSINNNGKATWDSYNINPQDENINYYIYINSERPRSISNLELITWKYKNLNITKEYLQHQLSLKLPQISPDYNPNNNEEIYTHIQVNDNESLPISYSGARFIGPKSTDWVDGDVCIYSNMNNQNKILQFNNGFFNLTDLTWKSSIHAAPIVTIEDKQFLLYFNEYPAYPFLNGQYLYNYNLLLSDIFIKLLNSNKIPQSTLVNAERAGYSWYTQFSATGDRYIGPDLILWDRAAQSSYPEIHYQTTVNKSIPKLYTNIGGVQDLHLEWENSYNTTSVWYSTHPTGEETELNYWIYNLSTYKDNNQYVYYIFEVDLV